MTPEIDAGALVLPEPGGSALKTAHRRYLKATLERWLRAAGRMGRDGADSRPPTLELIRRALASRAGATLACLASPAVGTPIHCWSNRDRWPGLAGRIEEAVRDAVPHLLLEMAARDLLGPAAVDWPHAAPALVSPSIGVRVSPPARAAGWRFRSGLLTVLIPGGEGPSVRLGARSLARGRRSVDGLRTELAFIPLEGSVRMALADGNPIASTEAHPEKAGNALDLGGRSEDDWRTALTTALSWIRERMPDLFDEMDLVLRQVVPVGYDPERHLSASYQEAVGTVYVTLHPDVLTMATALIHEFQHNKLHLATYSGEVLRNAFHPLYKSPVRPDPRPLWGILMAVHAFLPVAVFLRKLREAGHPASRTPEFELRLGEIDLKNREGMDTLRAHADWTPWGRALMDALEELDARHMAERRSRGLSASPTGAHEG